MSDVSCTVSPSGVISTGTTGKPTRGRISSAYTRREACSSTKGTRL